MSSSLHDALRAFRETLKPGQIRDRVDADVRRLRHAETDGIAAYEDMSAEVLRDLYRADEPEVKSFDDSSSSGSGLKSGKEQS